MLKKTVQNILKIVLAGFAAVAILSIVLSAYSLTPVHIENKKGNTDYVWPSNSAWVKMTEGTAFGRYDANGYNNKTVIEKPDVIILGSSHMEATNVMQNDNLCSVLNDKYQGELSFYNLGISGHHFFKVCQYLPVNMELYKESAKVVIIETSTVSVSQKDVDKVLNHNVDYTPSHSSGIVATLQRVPFLRLVYQQIEGGLLDLFMPKKNQPSSSEMMTSEEIVDMEAYQKLFVYLNGLQKQYGMKLVIFYHPTEALNEDGTIGFSSSEDELLAFRETAERNEIIFVDMTESFERAYYEEHVVPHGFSTGKLGAGHLNKYGHFLIAEELSHVIDELAGGMTND